jgi:exodeoxyribonuclease VII large subunit
MKIHSVAELTHDIKFLLEDNFAEVWVEGELSNYTAHHSGHHYFSLKDDKAVLQAVMFRGSNRSLKFKPQEGLSVVCRGKITVYEPRGNYQIIVSQMEPQGLGALQMAFEQLKKKLANEGLFDEDRKRALPMLPKRIGVISSLSGAALRDIIQVSTRRFPNIELLIHPVKVQGDKAAGQIAHAIGVMNGQTDLDLLIVGRGGGSMEDLWAFNEEVVARAIAESKVPVISAVGHETDFTIADFVADLRAPTPSAAAELAVPKKEDLAFTVKQWQHQLLRSMRSFIEEREEKINQLKRHIKDPRQGINEMSQHIDILSARAERAITQKLRFQRQEWKHLKQSLHTLSPLAILERGYSVVTRPEQTKAITNAQELSRGDSLEVRLARGRIMGQVTRAIDDI